LLLFQSTALAAHAIDDPRERFTHPLNPTLTPTLTLILTPALTINWTLTQTLSQTRHPR
jgi:hypothetical protein